MSLQHTADANLAEPPQPVRTLRGRWKWAAAILLIACVAQASLLTLWWDDPTHRSMSILFVWPATLFSLLIWWIFFSGWSWTIKFGSLATIAAIFACFIANYRFEWDGGMIPRRVIRRTVPTGEEIARQFLKNRATSSSSESAAQEETATIDAPPLVASDGDWTGFRGPRRDSIVRGASLRRNWDSAPPKEIWRHPVGRAWSAFAVVGKYAFTQEQRDEFESVVAYDFDTGAEIWVHQDKALLSIVDANGGPGPHATPQFDDGLIYTQGGTGILNCLDAVTGKKVWSVDIMEDAGDGKTPAKLPEWGISASPLIVDNLVIVIPGATSTADNKTNDKGVAAYDKKTGQLVWTHGSYPASYGSPSVETIAGTKQILIPNGNGLSSNAVDDGRELWFFPLSNGPKVNSSMPWVLEDQTVIFGTGYGVGTVRLELKHNGDSWDVSKRWLSTRFRPKFNDFVFRDGYVYGLDDGRLACMDVQNGSVKWQSPGYGYGQLLLVDDVMVVLTEDGELQLVPAVPKKPEVVATFQLFNSGFCWNHLAFVRGRIMARNANEAACLDVSEEASQ